MDLMNRAGRPAQTGQQAAVAGAPAAHGTGGPRNKKIDKFFRAHSIISVTLLFTTTILLVALIGLIMVGNKRTYGSQEYKYVDTSKMQAVFLNGGQVYFGDITSLNSSYVRLNNIYYLRVNQQVQPGQANKQEKQDISLVKLGCELHGPQDNMLINRDQVVFWENLKDDGQVAKAVKEYLKANPGEQKCDTQQNSQQKNPAATPNN